MTRRNTDPTGLSILARMLWLHIRDEGGYWSAQELAEQIPSGDGQALQTYGPALGALLRRGHVRQHHSRQAYGVTSKCVPPSGLELTSDAFTPNTLEEPL
jgi:hypothetical protein